MEKIKYLLNGLPDDFINKFKYDREAVYSITKYKNAQSISKLIKKYCKYNNSILDACSCVGGNLISFINNFNNVYGTELNKKKFNMLVNNIRIFLSELK